jgi:hypothetical protein
VVADGVHGPSRTAPEHSPGEQAGADHDGQAEEPEPFQRSERHLGDHERGGVGEDEPEQFHGRHRPAVEAARHGLDVEHQVLAEKDQGERGDSEVGALQAAGDRAEHAARDARDDHREYRRDGGGQAQAGQGVPAAPAGLRGEVDVRVGADRQEERVAHGQLARRAGQQVDADRADGRRHREEPGLQPETLQVERRDDRRREQDGRPEKSPPRHGPAPSSRKAPRGG